MKPLDDRIGVSTLCMPRIPIEEAVGRIQDAGFKAIEIVPVKVQRDSNIDYWMEYFTPTKRKEMKSLLKTFETVTVHSSSLGVNICHTDSVERQRAIYQYNAIMEFAVDIGAQIVTMHSGNAGDRHLTDKYHLDYGQTAAEYAARHNLTAGYEFFRPNVIAQIGSPHFGINFDIGHAAQRMPPSREKCTQGVLEWIEQMMPVIVEFHVHGVFIDGESMIDHQPFHRNTALDYSRIISLLIEKNYQGPLMLEIEIPSEPETTIAYCKEAKMELLRFL
ncbi:sugar phosphate isomerase/epimerase [bacterium]|nr:sugar phosphate isomerase/epimerase [bacterium]